MAGIPRTETTLAGPSRPVIDVNPLYWFSMLAASALGTNLGDFWVDELLPGGWTSFASLAVISLLGMIGDRLIGGRSSAGYWLAIVALRAAATNVADALTHDLKLGYVIASLVLAVATLVAGYFTRVDATNGSTPRIDFRYWGAMFIAGVFGTTAGDLVSHGLGLFAAAGMLCVILVGAIGVRCLLAPTSVMAYLFVVLAERCAGTPVGDGLASGHGVGLGLPIAIACTGGLLFAGLLAGELTERVPRLEVSSAGRD